MPKTFALPKLREPLPYKLGGASFCILMSLALFPSAAFAHDGKRDLVRTDARNMPVYYENLCVAQIDHGNEGDEWLDSLDDCRQLALRLKQLEKTASSNKSTESE